MLLRLRIEQVNRLIARIQDRLSQFRTKDIHNFIIACNGGPGKGTIASRCHQRGAM